MATAQKMIHTLATVHSSHRQAIQTKYLGPTNFRGARIKASCESDTVTVSWNHALDVVGNHEAAAQVLLNRTGWTGEWVGGVVIGGVHVFVQARFS